MGDDYNAYAVSSVRPLASWCGCTRESIPRTAGDLPNLEQGKGFVGIQAKKSLDRIARKADYLPETVVVLRSERLA